MENLSAKLAVLEQQGIASRVFVVNDGEATLDYLYCRGKHAGRMTGGAVILLNLIPVVVLTSSREEADLLGSYKHGANAYVVKPIQFEEFMKAGQGVLAGAGAPAKAGQGGQREV